MSGIVMSTSSTETETVNRIIRYRLYPGDAETGNRLQGTAGAARFIWNLFVDLCELRWETWKANPVGPKPSVSFFTLGKLFTQIRKGQPEAWLASALKQVRPDIDNYTWLQAYASKSVKQALKDLELAYQAYFNPEQPEAGLPLRKGKYRTTPSFSIPCDVRIRDGMLHVPKVGKLRLKDHGRRSCYDHCEPRTVRIRMEGSDVHPKWYAYVCYEVPVALLPATPDTGAIGVDRNVGQCTDSDGKVYEMPNTDRTEAKIKRYQRKHARQRKGSHRRRRTGHKLGKLHRKRARTRDAATHETSRKLADKAQTVVLEDLDVKGMTRSAKGTVDNPGTNVKAKSGLNRAILASGWGQMERKLAYKAGGLVKVPAPYTSQTCCRCGHVDRHNRISQARFRCVACGFTANADHNAAINILGLYGASVSARPPARGIGAAARRGALPPCPPSDGKGTPATREQGGRGAHAPN